MSDWTPTHRWVHKWKDTYPGSMDPGDVYQDLLEMEQRGEFVEVAPESVYDGSWPEWSERDTRTHEDLIEDGYRRTPECEQHIAQLTVDRVPGSVRAVCEFCGQELRLTGIAVE